MKISFVKLGHEECWLCESFDLHSKATSHKKELPEDNCEECSKFAAHQIKYISARKQYQEDSSLKTTDGPVVVSADLQKTTDGPVVVSADLQKVIMLRRLEMFKEVIFTPRIIAFNQNFVVTGKHSLRTAAIWHEAIAGRSKEDITSTFFAFLLSVGDTKHMILWLDNCAAQNKYWTLLTFFIYVVKSEELALESLTLKYFEPGHTFMAADSFHHQVERSLKKMGKIYDFEDFTEAVKHTIINTKVISMDIHNFFNWENGTSQYKLNKITPRPYQKLLAWTYIIFLTGRMGHPNTN
ncbi:hypothetical protein QE152_g19405 [Popillia japonica]|uniref:DUF7869 domain-containing protein n=1 Tax=Popillia japonica TaxID=7064 RepID=A0AAW1KS16_POPJA